MKQQGKLPGSDIKRRVSFSKKTANDFQRQKDIIDIYDLWAGDFRDGKRNSKFNINYELFNGRLDVKLYEDPVEVKIEKDKPPVKLSHQKITHYPLISQVANAMHGEMISRPFQPVAKDLGSFSQTLRNKKWNELLRQIMEADVFSPMRNELFKSYIQQNNIRDIFQLSPEQYDQMQKTIEQQVQSQTPDEVLDFMQNDFQTPTQRQAQQLLDYFLVHQDIKEKQSQGFKHAIITGEEYYRISDSHGEPIIELVNPKYFTGSGSQTSEWVQDWTWCKYEQWLSFEEVTQKYAELFDRGDYSDLEGFGEPIGGLRAVGDPRKDFVQNRVMYELSIDDGYFARKYDGVNYKTKAGQKDIVKLYKDVIDKYGKDYGYAFANYGVREAHFVWRDKRKLYRVKRKIGNIDKIFWQDEHYEEQPEDIEVREVWVDEVWEGTKLGSTGVDDIYVNIRPIPGQYKSIFNPFGVQLPYVGKAYNTHMGNAENVSIVDLGKSWQKEFDTTMAQLKHDMATDYGSLFLMSLNWKPDSMDWQQWFDIMRNSKVLFTELQKHGFGSIDPSALRTVTISKAADMAHKIQLLDYFKSNLVQSMNFNDTRIGSIGQYTTNANIQQSQNASYNQTEGFFETHRKIVEKALNMFMNRARLIYRNNEKTKFILDDITRTELEVSPEFWYEEWAIEFSTSTDEIRKVEMLRQQMQALVQNQMSFDGILQLSLASTPSDIINIMKKEAKRAEDIRQEQMQMQQQQFQAELQAQMQDKQAERQSREGIAQLNAQSGIQRTVIDAEKFRNAGDIDRDGQSDADKRQREELSVQTLLESKRIELANQERKDQFALKTRELDIKEKDIKSRPKTKVR